MSKVVKVLVQAYVVCKKCGCTCTRMTTAAVTEDGRIGEADEPDSPVICNACCNRDDEAHIERYKAKLLMKQWATGKLKTKGRHR